MIFSGFLSSFFIYLFALVGISFFTLLERKALGYIQIRKGPNKVGIIGILQPFSDALKLFTKEMTYPTMSNFMSFLIAPFVGLILALIMWFIYPSSSSSFMVQFGVLLFICVSRLRVYVTLAAGWSSNSKYALLGSLRSVAQTISYEVSIALIILCALLLLCTLNFLLIYKHSLIPVAFICIPLFLVWFTTTLAETNRTPFDFAEGESELVSGFNTEYRRGTFALIFIAEYINIIIISLFSSVIFFRSIGFVFLGDIFLMIYTLFFSFLFIWVRGSYPRIRYDLLMNLTWKIFLPFSLGLITFFLPVFFMFWCSAGMNGWSWWGQIWDKSSTLISRELLALAF